MTVLAATEKTLTQWDTTRHIPIISKKKRRKNQLLIPRTNYSGLVWKKIICATMQNAWNDGIFAESGLVVQLYHQAVLVHKKYCKEANKQFSTL